MFKIIKENIERWRNSLEQRIKQPLFSKLSTRLLFTLTILSALPLIIVGLFMTGVTRESIDIYIKNQHQEIAGRAGKEIILFLEQPASLLKLLVESQDISEMIPFTQNLIINKLKSDNSPFFQRVFVADSSGLEITTTEFGLSGADYSVESFYTRAMQGEEVFSPVYFNEEEEPYVISAHPIRRFDRIVGVLAAEIDLKSVWDLVDGIKIGESGNAFVININGQLIAHPDKRKVLDKEEIINIDSVRTAINSVERMRNFISPEGITMMGTFEYLQKYDWILVIQQPVEEAFAVAQRMLYQVFGFVGLVILLAILLAYLLEKRITAPINTLVKGVKHYADGNLNFRIQINKYEEIAVLAEEFNSMAERLLENQRKLRRVERLAAMSKFATLVSHEIRNPLNSMNINMQILKREMERPEGDLSKKQKYYDIIISEIQRMDNLINNFLMISRSPRLDFLPNDLHDILDEVVLMHTGTAEQQNVMIEKQYVGRKILANVDRDQLKQVFHNIIINALQAMPKGGRLNLVTSQRKIKNRLKQNVTALRIEFIDTGVGIPGDKIQDIFEFYYTSKKTGTGLGLAIARQIIDGHYGSIYVDSREGSGTRLSINIPLKSENVSIKKKRTARVR